MIKKAEERCESLMTKFSNIGDCNDGGDVSICREVRRKTVESTIWFQWVM